MNKQLGMKMRFFFLAAAVLLLGCFVSGCSRSAGKEALQPKESEKEPETENDGGEAPAADGNTQAEDVTETDAARRRAKLEILKSDYSSRCKLAEQYLSFDTAYNSAQAAELLQSELLRCYEENTLLAVELKTLVLGSLGAEVPGGFETGGAVDAVLEEYKDYITDSIKSSILSDIASDTVEEALKNGVDGALDSYRAGGSLTEALSSAAASAVDGVAAKIQDAPMQFALDILDTTTGGLIGTINDVAGYDTTPTALLNSLSDSAKASSKKVAVFLEKDYVTAADIETMMYQYSQLGNTLDMLGSSADFNWKENYEKMDVLYRQFVRNEMMIEMLDDKGAAKMQADDDIPGSDASQPQLAAIPDISQPEVSRDLEPAEQVRQLDAQIAEYNEALEALQTILDAGKEVFAPYNEYAEQINQVNADCSTIKEYGVQNFEVQYDMEGSEWIQENNKMNYAISKLSKFTPWGLTIGLMAAGIIDSSDKYYENMVSTNEAISDACEKCVKDARASLEQLNARLYFLNDLMDAGSGLEARYRNQCILQFLYEDGGDKNGSIMSDIEPYKQAAYEQLYLLGAQQHFVYQLYHTILTNESAAEEYEQQYQEIMEIVDPSGSGSFAESISTDRLAKYLIPVMNAGINAILGLQQVPQMDGRRDGFFRMYERQTGSGGYIIDYCYIDGELVQMRGYMSVCYLNKEPFYANGRYIYDGVVINPAADTDSAVLIEEAEWMYGLPLDQGKQDEFLEHGTRYFGAVGTAE